MDIAADTRNEVLDEATWQARRAAHEHRVDAWVQPHLRRRQAREAHPVEDFLFTYYSQRPAAFRRWHPGFGVVLESGGPAYLGLKGYVEVSTGSTTGRMGSTTGRTAAAVSVEYVETQRPLVLALHRLLTATANRPAQLGCFGLHEWAMVHRATESTEGTRHPWPLRLGPAGTDQVVESHRISCS
ncbi:MAG: 3-methyladenine DNA glycosylase, partial [Nocardioidaceae bacterium]